MQETYRYRPGAEGPAVLSNPNARMSDVALAADSSTSSASRSAAASFLEETIVHGGSASDPAGNLAAPLLSLPGFADCTLLGRGGMGVVYRARQLNLGREVAIKVMACGDQSDSDRRLRLQWEAEAAARLQHPNIVQIFEIGRHEGLDYLLLELVAGGTLKQRIAGQRQPVRDAAELIETLARAVHQAHLGGVIHRDLKPDNVLLTPDCIPKISDFGLAQRLQAERDPLAGAVVGTVQYMAPEQAWGGSRLQQIGPAADVYGLGVMLYELLTGRVPFSGSNPRLVLEQVWSAQPRRLREQRPDVPPDLEEICLKCLSKRPDERYISAEGLADDLARFLRGEPVQARRIGPAERLLKWSRRRPVHAALLLVLTLGAAGLLGGGAWYQTQLSAALSEARANLHSVQDTIDELLSDASSGGLAPLPQSESLERQMLSRAVVVCQRLLEQYPRDLAVRQQAARAQRQLADIEQLLGNTAASRSAYDRAVELSAKLVGSDQANTAFRRELAVAYNNRGNLKQNEGQRSEARDDYDQSLQQWKQLMSEHPEDVDFRLGLAASLSNRGRSQMLAGRFAAAVQAYQEALQIERQISDQGKLLSPQQQLLLPLACNNLGDVLHARGEYAAANRHFREGLGQLASLPADQKQLRQTRLLEASLQHNLAVACAAAADVKSAQEHFKTAIALLRTLHADYPSQPSAQLELAGTLRDKALSLGQQEPDDGDCFEEAIRLYEPLAAASPPNAQAVLGQSICLERLGRRRLAAGNQQGLQDLQQAHRLADDLAAKHPEEPEYASQFAVVLASEADWLIGFQKYPEARERLELAIGLQGTAERAMPEQVAFGRQLAAHYQALAKILLELGDLEGAADAGQSLARLAAAAPSSALDAGRLLARCVSLAAVLKGDAGHDRDGKPFAEFCAAQSVAALADAVRRGTIDARQLSTDPALAPLRKRADYQQVLSAAAATPAATAPAD